MKIIVIGTRGIPNIAGGVETICQGLYPEIVKLGYDVTIIRRTPYIEKNNQIKKYKGVKLVNIYAPKIKSLEAIVHTFLATIYAIVKRPDILHIHTIGPAFFSPLAKLFGLTVVVTSQGPDYDREKWGKFAKYIIKKGEFFSAKYANSIICVSNVIKNIYQNLYNRNNCHVIYNGVPLPKINNNSDYINSLNLEKNNYIIGVARFVEEKGFHDLIEAFSQINQTDIKLVLVGDAIHETQYSKKIKERAKKKGVVVTGFISGDKLNQIFSHAKLFVMPSYHEGLPLALLEAMSYNLDVLVSDIPANIEIGLDNDDYFKTGNVEELSKKIEYKIKNTKSRNFTPLIKEKYSWDKIAEQTIEVYKMALKQ